MLYVDSLNDSGPGSLRAALNVAGQREIRFRVAGTIILESSLFITEDDVEIRGDTAPAGGICIRKDGSSTMAALYIDAENVTLRHLRLRPGPTNEGVDGSSVDALTILPGANDILVSHCSLTWSVDECLGISGASNIRIHDCLIAEALQNDGHPKGLHSCGTLANANGIEFRRCLWAHNRSRNPRISGGRADIINCVIYIDGSVATELADDYGPTACNYLSNYQRFVGSRPYHVSRIWGENVSLYSRGNIVEDRGDDFWRPMDGGDVKRYYADSPHSGLSDDLIMGAGEAYHHVLANAGATLPKRDAIDRQIVEDVEQRIYRIIDHPNEVGGWPDLTI